MKSRDSVCGGQTAQRQKKRVSCCCVWDNMDNIVFRYNMDSLKHFVLPIHSPTLCTFKLEFTSLIIWGFEPATLQSQSCSSYLLLSYVGIQWLSHIWFASRLVLMCSEFVCQSQRSFAVWLMCVCSLTLYCWLFLAQDWRRTLRCLFKLHKNTVLGHFEWKPHLIKLLTWRLVNVTHAEVIRAVWAWPLLLRANFYLNQVMKSACLQL